MNKMIHKKYFPLCIFGAIFSCHAADSISITGNLVDNACAVSLSSQNVNVNLLMNAAKQLHSPGATTPAVPFSIELSQCGASATNVKVSFAGTPNIKNSDLLALDPSSGASGIGIQLLNGSRSPVSINQNVDSLQWISLVAGKSNTLYFYARLMATGEQLQAGSVNASATFSLEFQ